MTITICPRCNQRVLHNGDICDVQHECNSGNNTLDEEDVVIVGDWEDYTGSGIETNPLTQGTENKLQGTRAGVEGQRSQSTTQRGNRASTHRQRAHIQHINLAGGEQ